MNPTTKAVLEALAPLASSLLGAIGKLLAGASGEEARILWRQASEDIQTASIRLTEIGYLITTRDQANDARLGR